MEQWTHGILHVGIDVQYDSPCERTNKPCVWVDDGSDVPDRLGEFCRDYLRYFDHVTATAEVS